MGEMKKTRFTSNHGLLIAQTKVAETKSGRALYSETLTIVTTPKLTHEPLFVAAQQ